MAAPAPQQQPMVDHKREPCPDRILNDIGGAFAMGAVGGGIWHLIKGSKNSPSGYRARGALEAVRREAPRLGGSFANWGLTFALFDCSLQYLRKKAMIEGLGIALTKLTSPPPPGLPMPAGAGGPMGPGGPMPPGMPGSPGMSMPPPGMEAASGDGGGFWGSLFGGSAPAPAPVPVTDLSEDPFQPPSLPKEFVMHGNEGGSGEGSFKHN
ncbi:Mitochondrial import inner membrane translocase subunit Tim17 [Tetrabaena socialis]|uniref:Mitochondrial import inner membrane translocase subunit Tim17 n=1 Tax=Tetrabaena socialis TaxID=47790 RepID=A0A2J7ZP26_9CHLO|nr:Mitochondrial import inner membrane translocase subunit Tim17 [Tetrabaena socialis]|eukprot:PNH02008.1 Mitochondrial import inner membrane translocase subunit Tim17 [Tetrabaena socialis]